MAKLTSIEKEEYADKGNGHNDQKNIKTITEYRTPGRTEHDLIFVVYQNTKMPNPNMIDDDLAGSFAKTLDRMGKGEKRRWQCSFRRFVKTTISDSWLC